MADYIIATIKSWNIENSRKLIQAYPEHKFSLITKKEELIYERLERIKPRFVFFPHWSWIIPKEIYENFECVVFHMTDLPFGRGGSPLQNLLIRGIYKTKVSAIKVNVGIDTGPVYFKEPLDISSGSADEIFQRVSEIIFNTIIPKFLNNKVEPIEQQGCPVVFRRRVPEQSEIPEGLSQRQLFDFIRMLDGEGYPTAFQKSSSGKIYYRNARIENDVVYADAEFRREN